MRRPNERGETLVETLASIVVCTFAIIMLFTAAAVASRMNADAYDREVDIQRQHVPAERQQPAAESSDDGLLGMGTTKKMPFGGKTYVMEVYGGDSLKSYKLLSINGE